MITTKPPRRGEPFQINGHYGYNNSNPRPGRINNGIAPEKRRAIEDHQERMRSKSISNQNY